MPSDTLSLHVPRYAITYPPRPVSGGPIPLALPKTGHWLYEPKYNGWRVLVHAPSGLCYNRFGVRLSIETAFDAALAELRRRTDGVVVNGVAFDWFDCEGLERRHKLGAGSLIVLDWVNPHATYEARMRDLDRHLPAAWLDYGAVAAAIPRQSLLRSSRVLEGGKLDLWRDLLIANQQLGCPFYEGVVAKRADSKYPIQLRSPDQEFPFWMKHRWKF